MLQSRRSDQQGRDNGTDGQRTKNRKDGAEDVKVAEPASQQRRDHIASMIKGLVASELMRETFL